MENLESDRILQFNFPSLGSHGIRVWVMQSHGKLFLGEHNKLLYKSKKCLERKLIILQLF